MLDFLVSTDSDTHHKVVSFTLSLGKYDDFMSIILHDTNATTSNIDTIANADLFDIDTGLHNKTIPSLVEALSSISSRSIKPPIRMQ